MDSDFFLYSLFKGQRVSWIIDQKRLIYGQVQSGSTKNDKQSDAEKRLALEF